MPINKEECQRKLDVWQQRVVIKEQIYPQMETLICQKDGEIIYHRCIGERKPGIEIGQDSIFRIYSMTKPIVSVAIMQLIEQGKARLSDPIGMYIDTFDSKATKVLQKINDDGSTTSSYEQQPITIHHLLSHTSGISYGFDQDGKLLPLDGLYNKSSILQGYGPFGLFGHSCTLTEFCNELAKQPVLFKPGTAWHYGRNHDVIGRLIEILSGLSLSEYIKQYILEPLEMFDTGFTVPTDQQHRFVSIHFDPGNGSPNQDITNKYPNMYDANSSFMEDGGAGLVSTAQDYMKFCQCLLRGGISNAGKRIIQTETLKEMTLNHLPNKQCLTDAVADTAFSWIAKDAAGDSPSSYGLGFATVLDKYTYSGTLGASVGTFSWVGAAKTIMWIDPVEEIAAVSMTNLLNSPHYRGELEGIIYGCITERAKMSP